MGFTDVRANCTATALLELVCESTNEKVKSWLRLMIMQPS